METIKQMEDQDQIVISTMTNSEKQTLPLNVIISLALGTLAGMAVIFTLLLGANLLMN